MAQASIVTRNLSEIADLTDNLYKSIVIIGRRARQISIKTKEELNSKLMEFASTVDNLEEIFENREQIEISRFYERMPKPTTVAINEFLENEVYWRDKSEADEAEIKMQR